MFRSGVTRMPFAVIAVSVALTAACSGETQSVEPVDTDGFTGEVAEGEPATVEALVATASAVFGPGRAEQAHQLESGGLVVVTTTGIDVIDTPEEPARRIVDFTGQAIIGPSFVAPDGARVIVATRAPNTLISYDLSTGDVLSQSTLDADVREIAERGGEPPIIVTSSGLFALPNDDSGQVPIALSAADTGRTATVDARVIAPRRGTTGIDIVDGDSVELVEVDLLDGATVLDAHAAPGGAVAAVSSGGGQNEFDREDTVIVLDTATWAPRRTVPFGRPLDPDQWTVTDSSVVASDGDGLSVTSIADGSTQTIAFPVDSSTQSFLTTPHGTITVHRSGALIVWDDADWSSRELSPGGLTLREVRYDDRLGSVVAVDVDGGIAIWDIQSGEKRAESRFQRGAATSVAFDRAGDSIAVASTTGQVVVVDSGLATITEFAAAPPSTRIDDVAFSPATGRLATARAERLGDLAFDDTVAIWDEALNAPDVTIGGESEDVPGCAFFYNRLGFTADGAMMSTVSHDFSVTIHDRDGGVIEHLPPFDSTVLDTAFSPDGQWIAASTDSSSVAVWDTNDFSTIADYRGPPGGYASMEFLPVGRTVVASDLLGRIVRVDIVSGEELTVITEDAGSGAPIAISPDGALVAAPLRDTQIGIWSTSGGPQLATLSGHRGAVTDVEFSPDGLLLVSASTDGTARAWSIDLA